MVSKLPIIWKQTVGSLRLVLILHEYMGQSHSVHRAQDKYLTKVGLDLVSLLAHHHELRQRTLGERHGHKVAVDCLSQAQNVCKCQSCMVCSRPKSTHQHRASEPNADKNTEEKGRAGCCCFDSF